MNHLATELCDAAMIEMAMIDECGDLLASAAAMQVKFWLFSLSACIILQMPCKEQLN